MRTWTRAAGLLVTALAATAACAGGSDRVDAVDTPGTTAPAGVPATTTAAPEPSTTLAPTTTPPTTTPPPPPDRVPIEVVDVVADVGLTADTPDGNTNTFGAPCVADLDDDGDDDVIWSNHLRAPWDVYRGGPDGFVADAAGTWPAVDNHGCAVADFDGDGRLDIFGSVGACAGTCDKLNQLFLQQSDGSFVDHGDTFIEPPVSADRSRYPVVLDADGDDRPDLYVTADGGGELESHHRLYLNRGDHLEQVAAGVEDNGGRVHCALASDLDGDGATDLLTCRGAKGGLYALRNDGTGRFEPHPFGMKQTVLAFGAAVADLDRDGDGDLVVAVAKQLQVRLNRKGSFAIVDWKVPLVDGFSVATPDIDGDGWPDVYVAQRGSGAEPASKGADRLFRNLGTGTDWVEVAVPQAATGKGDLLAVAHDFRGTGADAVLVSNGYYETSGPRQVIALADSR